MKLPNVKQIVRGFERTMVKHSPEILMGFGIAGMISMTVVAVKATPKAMRLIEDEKTRRKEEGIVEPMTAIEVVKVAWKPYIPAVITGGVATACLIGSSSVSSKRNAALAAAYTLSESAFSEYKDKVVETIGQKKEQDIRDHIAKDRVDKDPVVNREVIITGRGKTLCYDSISGRYFETDVERIRKAVNELNSRLIDEMYISLNEFYYELGLKPTKLGDELGWNISNGKIELSFSSILNENDDPCLVIDYCYAPRYDFSKLM